MLKFIGGLVVGGGIITAIYRLHVIPKWQRALSMTEREFAALKIRARALGL